MTMSSQPQNPQTTTTMPTTTTRTRSPAGDIDPRRLHAAAITNGKTPKTPYENLALFNNLITLYSKSNHQSSSLKLFNSIPYPNTATWTSIISAFSGSSYATRLFVSMLRHQTRPNARTLSTLLKTCAWIPTNSFGPQIQTLLIKLSLYDNPFVGSALVSLYCKTRDLECARKVFDEMPERDEVCYASIINGLARNRRPVDALRCFVEMGRENVRSTFHSVSGAVRAGAIAAMLDQCRILHGHSVVTGLGVDFCVGTSLIDGYGKCGMVEEAKRVFDEMEMGGNGLLLPVWNAMMAGYAQRGSWGIVVELFRSMESRGIEPDEYSLLAVLTGFYNGGNVMETETWLNRMKSQYGLEPRIEHYTCLVGALGKVGRLDEAEKVVVTMPYEPDAAVYRVLLSSCGASNGNNPEVAWRMAEKLLEIDPNDDSAYVILANVFASGARWDDVKKVRKLMKDKGVRKEVGRSWIEVRGGVHVFFAGDQRHLRKDEIYAKLAELMVEIEKLGYVPDCDEMLLHEVEEKEKKEMLCYHSEKLAVAFGLLDGVTPMGKPLRIVKNLRICRDCHRAFKYISMVVGREIIVRDVHRYHVFLNGNCSCGDSW